MAGHRELHAVFRAVLFSAAASAAGETSPSLSDLINRYDELAVGSESAAVSNLRLSADHLSLVLASGSATAGARDGRRGITSGPGLPEYLSADPIEWPYD